MRPSHLVLGLPLLVTAFFAIAHADSYTAAVPPAPAPTVTAASPPPPPTPTETAASPPAPVVTVASPPAAPAPRATGARTPPPPPPAWTPVTDVNGETAKQVGQFAVRIYAISTRLQLVFVNVVSGQTQPCNGGYNYRLVIAVAGPGDKTARYDALVWGVLGTTRWKLFVFTPK